MANDMRPKRFVWLSLCLCARLSWADGIEMRNDSLSLQFDAQTGALSLAAASDGVRLFGGGMAPVDVCVGGRWRFSEKGAAQRPGVLRLDGEWDFRVEGGEWRRLRVPGCWEEQGVIQTGPNDPDPNWLPYNGAAYYRTSFHAPPEWAGKKIKLVIYGVDDEDWTSLNGAAVGHTGMDVENWWSATRLYDLPADLLKLNAANTLDVKVYDRGGNGGIVGSVLIGPEEGVLAQDPCALRMVSHRLEQKDGMKTLVLNCAAPDWEAQITCEMPDSGPFFRRRAEWRYVGESPAAVSCVRFNLPRACIDRPEDCAYTTPALWPPRDIPFTALSEGRAQTAHGAGSVPAAMVLHNGKRGLGLCATIFSEEEGFGLLAKEGKDSIDIHAEFHLSASLGKGDSIRLGDQVVWLTHGSMLDAIGAVGHAWRLAGFRLAQRSDWTYGASLYSLWPGGSTGSGGRDLGGFKNFRTYLLPRLQKLGLDVIWFNPTNPGGYAPSKYFDVDARYGTLDDLKETCDDAHRRQMRVWLDLVPHGPQERSPAGEEILTKHPDWVSREEDGSIKYWWGCLCCDYANPGWQAYQADVASFFVKRCGIDGWRVDCAQGSPPNLRPCKGLRPSQSGLYGALRLLQKTRSELTAVKPDAAILGETGAASHLSQCDFIYDWSFQQAALYALPAMPVEEWVPTAKAWLERQQAALPEGAELGLMRFLENHDQYKSVLRYGPGQESALISLCSLIPGLVFIYNEQDLGFGLHIEKLLKIRKSFEEFRRGRAIYGETASSSPSVFGLTRVTGDMFSVAVIDFSGRAQEVAVQVPLAALAKTVPGGDYSATEVYDGADLGTRALADWGRVSLALPAYGTRVIVFRRSDRPRPVFDREEIPPQPAQQPLSVSQEGDGVLARNAHYRVELSNGLIRSLAAPSGELLLRAMNVTEGERKIWPGRRMDLRESAKAEARIARDGARTVVSYEGDLPRDENVAVRWEARYTLDDSPEIGVEFVLKAPPFPRPARGQLGMELAFGEVEEWMVNTLEGQLRDTFSVTHPLGDMAPGHRYWRRCGLLWESSQLPPDGGNPIVGAKAARTWVALALPPLLSGFENAYLREKSSDGQNGLTLRLAWLDEKGSADLAGPLRAAFALRIGAEPGPPTGTIAGRGWNLSAQGPRYCFRNSHCEVDVCRSLGGSIVRLAAPGGESAVAATEVYSDKGIYSSRKNSVGKDEFTIGSSRNDFEGDVFLSRAGDGLAIRFNSFLRLSYWGWANVASPRVQYEVSYGVDDSPKIRLRCGVRPMLSESDLKAFLAQTVRIATAERWAVDSPAGPLSGQLAAKGTRERVWESRKQGLAPNGQLQVELLDGRRLRFGDLRIGAGTVQDIFLLNGGGNTATLFFAFFDGTPERCRPAWRSTSYTMELVKP